MTAALATDAPAIEPPAAIAGRTPAGVTPKLTAGQAAGALLALTLLTAGAALRLPPAPTYGVAALVATIAITALHDQRMLDAAHRRGVARVGYCLTTALAAGGIGRALGWSPAGVSAWVTVVTGVLLAAVDVQLHRLPFRLTGAIAATTGAALLVEAVSAGRYSQLGTALACGAVAGAVALTIAVASGGQLGLGDVALLAALSFSLGRRGPGAAITGVVAGLLMAVFALQRRDRPGSQPVDHRVPLGPALFLGWYVVIALRAP